MKKKISLIFLSALVLISCTNEPAKKVKTVKPNGDYKTGTATINTERGKKEKITLENTVFKKMGLPLPTILLVQQFHI